MPSLAITGTMGSGKSAVLDLLTARISETGTTVDRFSADEENRRLLDGDPVVRELVSSALGEKAYTMNGKADREWISGRISENSETRKKLEAILHPRLQNLWKPLAEKHRHCSGSFFAAEIPLLYENGLESFFDRVILVACSESVRLERLERQRGVPRDRIARWITLQQPQSVKMGKTDHLIWNDGSPQALGEQILHFLKITTIA